VVLADSECKSPNSVRSSRARFLARGLGQSRPSQTGPTNRTGYGTHEWTSVSSLVWRDALGVTPTAPPPAPLGAGSAKPTPRWVGSTAGSPPVVTEGEVGKDPAPDPASGADLAAGGALPPSLWCQASR
jgi:hypothetical protein